MQGPGPGQITVDFIQNHWVHGVIFEGQSYFDFVRYGALQWLYDKYNGQKQKIAELEDQVAQLRQLKFGVSSEQSIGNPEVEPVPESQPGPDAEASPVVELSKERAARNCGRKPLPRNLPREPRYHEASSCPCCQGSTLHLIGEEITEQLTVIPIQVKVLEHRRKKYRCRHCDKVFTAEGPKHLIEKSSYDSPEFMAQVACYKYQFGLPLYRQEKMFNQMDIPINRTTLANLMIACADKMVAIREVLHDELLRQFGIHADETPIQVLKEPGRKATTKSQLWLYRSNSYEQRQIVLFDYQETRSGEHPRNFLNIGRDNAYTGHLMTDAYPGYNNMPGVTRGGCMTHLRRKFVDCIRLLPGKVIDSPAHHAVELIGRLYTIERRIKGMPHRERKRIRQEESLPILLEFKTWLDDMASKKVASKTPLGKAINYALAQWPYVIRYVEDGRLDIDNNIAERDIRSFAIGRKNWLFADSVAGAHANATMYSLVETAKANGLNPFDYLAYVFKTMPTLRTADEVQRLLPWNMPQPSLTETLIAA